MNNKKIDDSVQVVHGAGGTAMEELLQDHVLSIFTNKRAGAVSLDDLDDGGSIEVEGIGSWIVTTDSHVVKPLFFPGGDIGSLAVCGTVNDLAVMGSSPMALTSSLIIEEGFSMSQLDSILESMDRALREADVPVIAGDTKVMGSGELDGVVINTAGIGRTSTPVRDRTMEPGDRVIISGSVGDHGMALMQCREGLSFESDLVSDVAPLNSMLNEAMEDGGIKAMKDPTRGGIAAALNEMAAKSGCGILIYEEQIPIKPAVRGISDLLGISPYEIANEGKAIIVVEKSHTEQIMEILTSHAQGKDAAIVGIVRRERSGQVVMETEVGGKRFLEPPLGDPVPRIC